MNAVAEHETREVLAVTRPTRLEMVMSVAILVFFSGALTGLRDAQALESGKGTLGGGYSAVMSLVAYSFILFVTARDSAFVPRGRRKDVFMSALVGLALVSVAWSTLPSRTLTRGIQLLFTTWFGAYLSRRYETDEQVLLLGYALAAVAALSVLAVIFVPDLAIMHGEFEGAWRGAFSHKNMLGRIAFLGCCVFPFMLKSGGHRKTGWAGLLVSAALLLLSTSRSALVGVLVVAALIPLYRSLRSRGIVFGMYAGAAVLVPAAAGLWIYGHLDDMVTLLGRNLTLSGRTSLWIMVASFIAQRPLLGYGYNAFWQGMNGDSGFISLALRWEVPHAHNGVLELALDTGLIGVTLFCCSFVHTFREAVRVQKYTRGPVAMWPLVALTFVLISNTTETSLLRMNNTVWLLYLMLAFGLGRARHPAHVRSDA